MAKKKRARKHIPQRTCVGCRKVLEKRKLIRLARTPEGVLIDRSGKLHGRGAYLHDSRSCWALGLDGRLGRALKTELTQDDLTKLTAYIEELPDEVDEIAG